MTVICSVPHISQIRSSLDAWSKHTFQDLSWLILLDLHLLNVPLAEPSVRGVALLEATTTGLEIVRPS